MSTTDTLEPCGHPVSMRVTLDPDPSDRRVAALRLCAMCMGLWLLKQGAPVAIHVADGDLNEVTV